MVHVGLDELECLIFNHLHRCVAKIVTHLSKVLSAQAKAAFRLVKGFAHHCLHVNQAFNRLAHTEAEVTEPLVIERHGPVL